MNCPYCQREMESGWVQAPQGMVWSSKQLDITFSAGSKDDLWLGQRRDFLSPTHMAAFLCRPCKLILARL